jgi:hypothetical protein
VRHLGQCDPADRRHHPAGQVRHRHRGRPGQASAGCVHRRPGQSWLPQWYAENGQFVTTKFFGIKANKYIHDHNISQETLARRQQELPQRRAEPECVPPQGDLRRRDPQLAGPELPVDAVHVLRPDEGRPR